MRRTLFARFLVALVGFTTVVQAQARPTPMPPGTNVIVGRVLELGSERPVGGAIVTLTGQVDATSRPLSPEPGRGPTPPSASVMTTMSGAFVFRNLPAGLYSATTRAFGYVNADFPATVIDLQNSQKPLEVPLHVWKYASISGRVVDERGEPVAGVAVDALRRTTSGGGALTRRGVTALTDDRGEYRLAQLLPGDYVAAVLSTTTTLPESVAALLDPSASNRETSSATMFELLQSGLARTYGCPTCFGNANEGAHVGGFVLQRPGPPVPPAPDGRPLGFANTYYPGTTVAANATALTLGSGDARNDVDLVVQLVPTVAVAGSLIGPDGPLPHVAVRLAGPGTDLNDLDPPGVATAVTDARGAFMFLAVVPGDYTLSAAQQITTNGATTTSRPLFVSHPISVSDAGVAGLTLAMQPGLRMSGRVDFRGTSGATIRPTSRQAVALQPLDAQVWRTLQAVVQPDGTFQSAGDPPGRYTINAFAAPGWYWQSTTLAGRPVPDDVIQLASSELSSLVLTFGQTTNHVSGRVSDSNGAPDGDAAVIVFPADSTAWREGIFTSRRERKVYASSTGSFDISTLVPGEYYVAAVSRGLTLNWQTPQFLERLMGSATRVSLGPEEQRNLTLRSIALSGREP
jgi:protocatechuate 3,4-dioxygenase beta subunit